MQEMLDGLSGIDSLGAAYQAATGIIALLFIFIFVRFYDIFRYLILSSLSNRVSRSDIHIYSSEIKNIEILTGIIGVALIALLTMRLSVMEGLQNLFAPIASHSVWRLGGITLGGILALMLGERVMLYAGGAVSEHAGACNAVWHIKLLHFSTAIILVAPVAILALLTEDGVAQMALYCSVAVCSISLILFAKETFLLFRAQRFSIFHWILYLCALEIFPLSLLLAPICRG